MPDQDRDLSVERWLRQTPPAGERVESAACLDAETLAAWAEGLLAGSERAAAEAHASGCARCQAMLAIMVRTMPGPSPSAASPLRKWLMMLSPVMATGAAVAIWFAVDQRPAPSPVDNLIRNQRVADRAPEAAPAVAAPAPTAAPVEAPKDALRKLPEQSLGRDAAKLATPPATELDAPKERENGVLSDKKVASATRAKAETRNERKDEAAAVSSGALAERTRVTTGAPGVQSKPERVAPPPPAPQQAAQAQQSAESPLQSQRQQAEPQALKQAPAPPAAAAASPAASASASGGRVAGFAVDALHSRAANGDFAVPSSDASARWRVVGGRTVQGSRDAGATWTNVYSADDGVTLTAGAAPSATVCWLVGRGGVIVMTTDGRLWQRLKFPEPVDLATITAADARVATVTTPTGRSFVTTDGGRSWAPR